MWARLYLRVCAFVCVRVCVYADVCTWVDVCVWLRFEDACARVFVKERSLFLCARVVFFEHIIVNSHKL